MPSSSLVIALERHRYCSTDLPLQQVTSPLVTASLLIVEEKRCVADSGAGQPGVAHAIMAIRCLAEDSVRI
jgi:hypothetical protein